MIIRHLTYRYARRDIFHDYTCTLPDSCAVLGANGTGKTTLLKLISGVLTPDEGSIEFPDKSNYKSALCLDDQVLFEEISLRRHLEWLIDYAHRPNTDFESIVERCGLDDIIDAAPCELSAGQRQWAAVMLTHSVPANIHLYDEPLRHLDESHRKKLIHFLKDASQNGRYIIVTGHENDVSLWNDIFPCISLINK